MSKLSPVKLEEMFKKYRNDHEKTDTLIEEQAELENTALLHYFRKDQVRPKAIYAHLERKYPQMEKLHEKHPIVIATNEYYQGAHGTETTQRLLDDVVDCWFADKKDQKRLTPPGMRAVYRRIAELQLSFVPRKNMKSGPFLQVNHGFQVGQDVALLPFSTPQDVGGAVLHDLLEDTIYGRHEGLEKLTETKQIENATVMLARDITGALRFEEPHHLNDKNRERIAIIAAAVGRLSLNTWLYDYMSYLENISDPEERFPAINPSHKPIINKSIHAAKIIKASDKRWGMTHSERFNIEQFGKLEGKTIATIMALEGYEETLKKKKSHKYAHNIDYATRRMCATTFFTLDNHLDKIQKIMNYAAKAPARYKQQGIGGRPRMWNRAIDEGILSRLDREGLLVDLLSLGYRKLASGIVTPILKEKYESDDDAKLRLRTRSSNLLGKIPGGLIVDNLQSRNNYRERIRTMKIHERKKEYMGLQQWFNMSMLGKHGALAAAIFPNHQFKRDTE